MALNVFFPSTTVTPEASADSLVIKAAPGKLGEILVVMDPTAGITDRCAMLFDATSLPANGTDPVWRFPVVGSKAAAYAFPRGLEFTTGIVVALSSTWDDLTVTVGLEAYFHAQYE